MNTQDWQPVASLNRTDVALSAVWFKLADYVSGGKLLKFSASGE